MYTCTAVHLLFFCFKDHLGPSIYVQMPGLQKTSLRCAFFSVVCSDVGANFLSTSAIKAKLLVSYFWISTDIFVWSVVQEADIDGRTFAQFFVIILYCFLCPPKLLKQPNWADVSHSPGMEERHALTNDDEWRGRKNRGRPEVSHWYPPRHKSRRRFWTTTNIQFVTRQCECNAPPPPSRLSHRGAKNLNMYVYIDVHNSPYTDPPPLSSPHAHIGSEIVSEIILYAAMTHHFVILAKE